MEIVTVSGTTAAAEAAKNCCICGKNHASKNCDFVKITKHVRDKEIPSKAKLSLPGFLQLQILTDGSYSVVTKAVIERGTQFGPFQAGTVDTLDPAQVFPLKIFDDNREYYLDTSNENECNWMIFVSPADSVEEQNLVCYQDDKKIYFVAIKEIGVGSALKIWYSSYYALKMQKKVLQPLEDDPLKNIDINTLIKKQQNIMERKTWTCKFCSQVETNIVVFANHMMAHYRAQLRKTCEICNASFMSKKTLTNHLKIVHNSNLTNTHSKVPAKPPELPLKPPNRDGAVGGPLLNDLFTDSSDLQQPDLDQFDLGIDNQNLLLDTDHLNVDNLLNENVKDLDHFNFEIDDNQKQIVCDICLKQFANVKLLVTHLRLHTGDLTCHKCLKIFCRKENLKSHICNLSGAFKCDLCSKMYTQRKYLSRHLAATHAKKYNCTNCGKCYNCNKELQDHNCSEVSAVDKEKFICSFCNKVFFRQIYLRKHLKIHGVTAKTESSTVCEVCGLLLGTKNSYYTHMKLHRQLSYVCEICDKKFCRRDSLNIHVLGHTTVAQFACTVCPKKFKFKKKLNEHMRNHQDVSLKCGSCEKSFKQRSTLNKHVRTKHGNSSCLQCYRCPICDKAIKLRSSLSRHLRRMHANITTINSKDIKPKLLRIPKSVVSEPTNTKEQDEIQNEIDTHIDNLLNSTDASLIDKEAVDSLVEELDMDIKNDAKKMDKAKEVCLSIPDLTEADQEITLDKNAYILDNGTIVQPQHDSDKVIIYVLDPAFP